VVNENDEDGEIQSGENKFLDDAANDFLDRQAKRTGNSKLSDKKKKREKRKAAKKAKRGKISNAWSRWATPALWSFKIGINALEALGSVADRNYDIEAPRVQSLLTSIENVRKDLEWHFSHIPLPNEGETEDEITEYTKSLIAIREEVRWELEVIEIAQESMIEYLLSLPLIDYAPFVEGGQPVQEGLFDPRIYRRSIL
jgi:hypothetical protein